MIKINKIPDHVIEVYKGTVAIEGIAHEFFIQNTLEMEIDWKEYPYPLSQKALHILQNEIRETFIKEFYENGTKQ